MLKKEVGEEREREREEWRKDRSWGAILLSFISTALYPELRFLEG